MEHTNDSLLARLANRLARSWDDVFRERYDEPVTVFFLWPEESHRVETTSIDFVVGEWVEVLEQRGPREQVR